MQSAYSTISRLRVLVRRGVSRLLSVVVILVVIIGNNYMVATRLTSRLRWANTTQGTSML